MTAVTTAMLLAAGLGTRMRPLTDDRPKPMLHVAGKPMLEHALDKCVAAGVKRIVINLHHCGAVIEQHFAGRTDVEIIYSREPEILDTGGGVKQALPHLGNAPFYCINTDLYMTDAAVPSLTQLAGAWDDARMDVLLLMKETDEAHGFEKGDYKMTPGANRIGPVFGRGQPAPLPYVFTGTMVMHPRVYNGMPGGAFSNRVVFDAAEKAGRLWGLVHDGAVYHSSTPEDLARTNKLLEL